MINLNRWFANPFDGPRISFEKLRLFAADVISRLTNNNGSGLFTAILAQLVAAYQAYFGDITDVDLAKAIQKSFTASKDNLFKTFQDAVSRQEGLVRSKFGKDDPRYQEFFPLGLTEFKKATLANVETLMTRMVNRGQYYVADLGTDFVNEFSNILTNYQAARTAQLSKKSTTADQRTERHQTRANIETELFRAMFVVGQNFPGNVDRCLDFFDQSIIRPDKNSTELFDIESNQVINLLDDVQPGSFNGIKIKNTSPAASGVVLYIYTTNTANGGWNGAGITINPGEEKTLDENDFGALQAYLNVQNQSPNSGSFEVRF